MCLAEINARLYVIHKLLLTKRFEAIKLPTVARL